eukprot:TRINITY_DN69114_c0_g1_i1.p1 TRINITY_DN69114_c0_g1~~TRINITY_DN69114_c0_g1_i1.p1  ORF type:complete len:569 (-),score=129.11 TRINITY_DN69114_c0_g1_i1:428-2134(-)
MDPATYTYAAGAQPGQATYWPPQTAVASGGWPQNAPQYGWPQVGSAPSPFVQQPSPGFFPFGQQQMQPQMQPCYYQQQQVAQQFEDPVEVLLQEIGVEPEEDVQFGWIAEYALQPEALPARWSMNTDPASGRVYYTHADNQTSVWEHPLAGVLRAVIDMGRLYLRDPTDNYFEDQKKALWDHHEADLKAWHGPITDEEGRACYVNSASGALSYQDPRQDTQHLYDLESTLLDAFEETLVPYGDPEDLPAFGREAGDKPFRTQTGAEVLTFDSSSVGSPASPTPPSRGGLRTPRTPRVEHDASKHKSAYESMFKSSEYVDFVYKDEEEAQYLRMRRKVRERQNRKRKLEEAALDKRRQELKALEEERRADEARRRAICDAEEERKAQAHKIKLEEELREAEARQARREAEEAARREEEERAEAERQRVLAEKQREREEQERQAEEMRQKKIAEQEARRKAADDRLALLARLKEVVNSRDEGALKAAIADGEAAGLHSELEPVRQALEEEVRLRHEAALKFRQSQEKLAAEFKTAKEAQDFGGAVLAARWRAAVREVSKPMQEGQPEEAA